MTAAGFLPFKMAKRRVAIAGKVVDGRSTRPVAGGVATITSGPAAFLHLVAVAEKQAGSAWAALAVRPDRAVTAADGCFAFAELPDGSYTVAVAGPPELRYGAAQQSFTVQRDGSGNIAVAIKLIPLPPTGVRGTVKGQDTSAALSLARVRVEGSGEVGYCDASGAFFVSGVQSGARRLSIGASGYRRGTAAAQIVEGEIVDVGTITLQPAGA